MANFFCSATIAGALSAASLPVHVGDTAALGLSGFSGDGLQTFDTNGVTAFAVIIAVERLGFEGPDYRWIAVTRRP